MKKRIISTLLVAAMATTMFAGCGEQKTADAPAPSSEAQADAGSDAEAPAADDYSIEIKMSHVFAPEEQLTKSLQEVCDNIDARTNGHVKMFR